MFLTMAKLKETQLIAPYVTQLKNGDLFLSLLSYSCDKTGRQSYKVMALILSLKLLFVAKLTQAFY